MFTREVDDGVRLRMWEPRDAEPLHRLILANRETIAPWMPWAIDPRLDAIRQFIADSRRRWAAGELIETAIVADGEISGAVGLNRFDQVNRTANVGYWLAAAATGRGLVTRSVAAMLDHAFDDLGLHRVELRAGTENLPSRAVAARLGFTEEGVLREAEWIGDRVIDHVMHRMLAREWAALRRGG